MLMIPNMYRIAGGLLPAVIHVASRVVSKQALSLLCEHSDVMATRQTGWAILSSHCVQESHDLALVAHLAAITTSIPFLHFFDGWYLSLPITSRVDAFALITATSSSVISLPSGQIKLPPCK